MKDNLENKIKQEFQQREIKPSANSWEVLNAQLEVKSTKKENKKLWFLVYAAVFVGLLFGLVNFFNSDSNSKNQPVIVKVNDDEKKEDNTFKTTDKIQKITNENLNNTAKIKRQKNEVLAKNNTVKTIDKSKNNTVHGIRKTNQKNKFIVNNVNIALKEDVKQFVKLDSNNLKNTIIEKNNETVITKNVEQNLSKKRRKLLQSSDEDIDKLLASVTENNKIKVENVQLHSDALKFVVESNIKQPLSKKIYKTLVTGVHTVEDFIDNNN